MHNLTAPHPSIRLRAALAAGIHPDPAQAALLVERCAVEPDFFVRDMLTWALTRLPAADTVPLLRAQLTDTRPQARSQALHTLSKLSGLSGIGDPTLWEDLTPQLLHDPDPATAQSAWRAAVALVPDGGREELAVQLTGALARGDLDLQRSLSRALVALDDAAVPALTARLTDPAPEVRAHARATLNLLADPDADFAADLEMAKKVAALGPTEED